MRYKGLLVAIIASAAMALITVASSGGMTGYAAPEISQYRLGFDLGMQEGAVRETYTFGILGSDGSCSTMKVEAMHPSYAYHYVRELCPDCTVEDITGVTYQYGDAGKVVPMSEKYCTLRK